MSTYLVTGGCGFIGSHLVDALLIKNHKVIVIDDLSTGKIENLSPKAELIVGNICDQDLIVDTLKQVDGCFHLAARLGLIACKEDWVGTNNVNLSGTIMLFDGARKMKAAHKKTVPIIYASSCAVYGDSTQLPLIESYYASPLSAYGADKLGCELHGKVASEVHEIPNIGLRLFNVYGPRQNAASFDSGVIPIFIDRIKNNQPVDILGNGEQTRDFVHVSDVVDYFMFFMNNIKYTPNVYNVCTGQVITINKLIALMGQLLNRTITKNFRAPRPGDVMHSYGDTRKSLLLGIKAKTPLQEGLETLLSKI